RRPANGRRRGGGGRPRRTGGRAGEALELVRQNPEISVAEIADRLGMKQRNYLYRIMANLQSEGAVEKRGRGFVAR
ncbi:MAG: winged helix-turn-helix transcriptional regulator, partial [Thermoleophilaceae bacterium]|nr:winged helix-turn-helix transcriptional regulator [Thermoleophilaceae bacterium]